VRHACLAESEEPYDKLKRALRAEIDKAAWRGLYRTVSRAFPRPESGRIAVTVISEARRRRPAAPNSHRRRGFGAKASPNR
jgi:hypothetical protein